MKLNLLLLINLNSELVEVQGIYNERKIGFCQIFHILFYFLSKLKIPIGKSLLIDQND